MELPRYKEAGRSSLHVYSSSLTERLPSLKMVPITVILLLGSIFVLTTALPLNDASHPHQSSFLQFTKDGTFQLSIFDDLHFGESKYAAILTMTLFVLIVSKMPGTGGDQLKIKGHYKS